MYGLTVFDPSEIKGLKEMLAEYRALAWEYAEANPDEVDCDRIYSKLCVLQAQITAEVSDLFEEN